MSIHYEFIATAARGMSDLLAQELTALGAADVRETPSGATFSGPFELGYRVCLWSRTASRVLMPIARFPAASEQALYEGVQAIHWAEHFSPAGRFAVDFTAKRSWLDHSHYGALKVKDAVVDQFRADTGERPSVDTERPDVWISVRLQRDEAVVSIDLSGAPLHRRGYRKQAVVAPLKENLAATILLRARWPQIAAQGGTLVDPMCGSGTLPIEAALMAGDIAPGLLRDYFGFLGWRGHEPLIWQDLLDEARQRRAEGLTSIPVIVGYDSDRGAVHAALGNIEQAGLTGHVHVERRELARLEPPPKASPGLVVVNPPYGERLGERKQLEPVYASLGDILKQRFTGWHAAVFTGNPELAKGMGLRARRFNNLFNGTIPCRLLHFDVETRWFIDRSSTESHGVVRPAPPEKWGAGAVMLRNRLRKNRKELGKWARREGIDCYRLYDADLPEYAVAVDVYQGEQLWVHVQEYAPPPSIDRRKADQRLREALGVVAAELEVDEHHLFLKIRERQKGKAQYEKQAEERNFHQVREGGLTFLVNFADYLDTGLFLDHRLTRAMLRELAQGRHFLNLFAYTGTASVYAAAGNAASTTTVDMSQTYLDWAQRNLALNGFSGQDHQLLRADCTQWLEEQAADNRQRYGLIFLDPPTFSTSKRMETAFDVQRDHVHLISAAVKLLEPDGVLIFSNNFRKFRIDEAALSHLNVEDITRRTIPRDFARNPRIHNCWRISRDSKLARGLHDGVAS